MFDDVEQALSRRAPELLNFAEVPRAAVALILGSKGDSLDLLFIERSTHKEDPWSGNVGFPGGKMERGDEDLRRTAERETLEEVGIDLGHGRFLGRLSDVGGTRLRIQVACFVYGLRHPDALRLSDEVRDAFWVPLDVLLDTSRHGEAVVRFGDRQLPRPAFALPQPHKPPLWGLTYRLVLEFLDLIRGEDFRSYPK